MPNPTRRDSGGIGARIEEVSVLRGYSLRELGRRANVSPSMLSRVINGHREASPAIVSAVARALSVSLSVLHGQPYVHQLQADQLDRLTTPISTALDDWDIPLGEGDPPPRTLTDLRATVAGLERQRARAEHVEIAHELPALLAEVNAHGADLAPNHDGPAAPPRTSARRAGTAAGLRGVRRAGPAESGSQGAGRSVPSVGLQRRDPQPAPATASQAEEGVSGSEPGKRAARRPRRLVVPDHLPGETEYGASSII